MRDLVNERREDWARSVDENLASLNSGQRVWERDLDLIRKNFMDIDTLLRGDVEKERSGIISRLESIEHSLAMINSVLFVDATGTKGLLHDLRELKAGREDRRLGWANITKIIVALIMAGLVGRFYEDAWRFMTKKSEDPVAQAIERAKHPPRKHIRIKIDARTKTQEESGEEADGN